MGLLVRSRENVLALLGVLGAGAVVLVVNHFLGGLVQSALYDWQAEHLRSIYYL